jgi:DNA-binding CsgD family transcriptional regulator/tetratricopeptide (TPR) repeat protein
MEAFDSCGDPGSERCEGRVEASGALGRGRRAFDASAWDAAYAELTAADLELPLSPDDLERLAVSAQLVGRTEESVDLWVRAHHDWTRSGSDVRAARCAFWLALEFLLSGATARFGGWLTRARRLLGEDHSALGYDALLTALDTLFHGDAKAAYAGLDDVVRRSERGGDRDVVTLARLGRGQALIRLGQVAEGMVALDEVMVAVTINEVSPMVAGIAYCAVLLECQATLDVHRAREWTLALSRWCDRQPGLMHYRGQCLVHRSEVLQLQGAWSQALHEAQDACDRLAGQPTAGMAFYQLGEMHRLRGEHGPAEAAFQQASRLGRTPQPGLALLRLAQDDVAAAMTAIRAALAGASDPLGRSPTLGAYVEILLTAGDIRAARAAADELSTIANDTGSPMVEAIAAHAVGAVCLAEGDGEAARIALCAAWQIWRELDAPYGAARTRLLLALAHRRLGDESAAAMEFDAAIWVFRQLGADPDAEHALGLAQPPSLDAVGPLSAREREVLTLVAAGHTNREIATDLFISEHTVRRHLQNIFVKIDVPSRAAATAYALRHGLI